MYVCQVTLSMSVCALSLIRINCRCFVSACTYARLCVGWDTLPWWGLVVSSTANGLAIWVGMEAHYHHYHQGTHVGVHSVHSLLWRWCLCRHRSYSALTNVKHLNICSKVCMFEGECLLLEVLYTYVRTYTIDYNQHYLRLTRFVCWELNWGPNETLTNAHKYATVSRLML